MTPGAELNPRMLSQVETPWKSSIATTPPPAIKESIAGALVAMPSEGSVAGSLQQAKGEAKNRPLKPDKSEGTEAKPVTGWPSNGEAPRTQKWLTKAT